MHRDLNFSTSHPNVDEMFQQSTVQQLVVPAVLETINMLFTRQCVHNHEHVACVEVCAGKLGRCSLFLKSYQLHSCRRFHRVTPTESVSPGWLPCANSPQAQPVLCARIWGRLHRCRALAGGDTFADTSHFQGHSSRAWKIAGLSIHGKRMMSTDFSFEG